MSDKIKIIQDISLLYELSLSIGTTLDPQENCYSFLRTLITRKSLSFGSIWLKQKGTERPDLYDLFYILPHFRSAQTTISCDHCIVQELVSKPYFSVGFQDPNFQDLVQETKVGKGSYALFRLGELGFLKLFASNRLNGFSEMELEQLKQVIDKLSTALSGCFAHVQLQTETENRQIAQKALTESENRLRRTVDSSQDAVVAADEAGIAIEWSHQAEKLFGFTREEVLGRPLKDLFIPKRHWDLFEKSKQNFLQSTDHSNVSKRYEIKCLKKDGTEIPAELSLTSDKRNDNVLFVAFVRDITEQKKAKQEIELARNRMETLIANLQTGILLTDKNNKITLVNQAFCNIFGIEGGPENVIGYDCAAAAETAKHLFVDPDEFIQGIRKTLNDNVLIENEVFTMADGRILERNFIPLFDGDKEEGHLWQYRDITERQNAQNAIRESEEKYRGVLENMDLGLLEVDLEDNILHANNAFCQMLGYGTDELIGRNAREKLLPESSIPIMTNRLNERSTGASSVYEIQLKRKDGKLIWGLISGAPIKNTTGQIVGSIGIQFDLTDRKKLEHELAEAKQAADRARLAERQFLTHMSHEIRTPINAVIGMTHLLEETRPDQVQKEYLTSLRFSADSLLGIIDNILDLSKIDAGELEFEQRAFDLNYLLASLLQTFQYKVGGKDIQISQHLDVGIDHLVIGDPTRINQILTNLLGNALKFTERGEIMLSSRLMSHSDGQYRIEFIVHDTGIGIQEDKLETIFEYFKQADVQINRKFGGTGLGLTIVKQLIEKQGGSIRVESRLGIGSDFIFVLDFGDSGETLTNQSGLYELDLKKNRNLPPNLHFLIVEDNPLNQKLLCKTIETWEGTYKVANNGVEALEETAKAHFDVILMDIHMPLLDGCETTLAIRNDGRNPNQNVPIIALTAAAMSEDKRRAFEAGMNGFLTKPIAPKVLQEHILRAIQANQPIVTPFEAPVPAVDSPSPVHPLPSPVHPLPSTVHPLPSPVPRPPSTVHPLPSTLPPFDLTYLIDLSNGDYNFINAIIDAFLVESPLALQDLELQLNQQDWEQLYKVIHKVKPNYAMLGMKLLHESALEIESLYKVAPVNVAKITNLVEMFILGTKAVLPFLVQYRFQESTVSDK
jgi:PAS domain S-box-containing protein